MAITHKEKISSRKGTMKYNEPTVNLDFWIYGTSNETLMCLYVGNLLPTTYTVAGVMMWFESYSYEYHGNSTWSVSGSYKSGSFNRNGQNGQNGSGNGRGAGNTIDITIKPGSGSAKRYQSIETVEWYECTGDALLPPDFNQAIGVTQQGAEGVDVPHRKFEFTITKKFSTGSVPGSFIIDLRELQNRVNNADYTMSFNGMTITFTRGTLLFSAFPMKFSSDLSFEISYEFVAESGITYGENFTIGQSPIITKEGWEYLWVHYRDRPDPNNTGYTTKQPVGVYIEKVFEYGDFSKLVI